ncbi:MAG: glycosyltransferase family 87 protein [Vicinamibacteria bacterium]
MRIGVGPVVIGLVSVILIGLCLSSDPAKLSGGRFFSDGATYYTMGHSFVSDFDFEYTAADLARVKNEYPSGPGGIFLKRASGGYELDSSAPWLKRVPEDQKKIYFGKAMTYPVLAAPFVLLFGTRGFLVFNALCLIVAWMCAFVELRTRMTEGRALMASAALILATIAPIYIFWIQPELLNLALVSMALLAWRRDQPILSAVLFGIATYTKATHALLAAPLGFAPLFDSSLPWIRRLLETVRRGAVMIGCAVLLFGLNTLVTGEWNYQGGERKTFGANFPFERIETKDVTFGNSGEWMTTMKLGPLQTGEAEALGSGIAQSPQELHEMFLANLSDFWLGRYGGMLPYFAPAFLALLAFLVLGPREKAGWLALSGVLIFFYVNIAILPGPTNWYGGGGTVGNRYFTAVLPLAVYFLPRGRELLVPLLGTGVSVLFLLPAWLHPVTHSLSPALLASRPGSPITYLRAERAMLNDLSFCTDAWRKKQPYDDAEGDPPIHRPGSRHGYWLYFPDDGTFGRERVPGMFYKDGEPLEGFRVRRGERTEVLLRANEPVDWIDVTLYGTPQEDDVTIQAGGESQRVVVPASGTVTFKVVPGPSVMYYDSFVYSVHATSHRPGITPNPASSQTDHTMIHLALHVSPRPVSVSARPKF